MNNKYVQKVLGHYANGLEIEEDINLFTQLGLSKLAFLNIIVHIEKEFGIRIKYEQITSLTTVGALLQYIEESL